MEQPAERIQSAIEAGEIIRIVYDGGSRPGDSRDIAPIKIKGGMLHSRCIASNRFKIFTLAKIREISAPDSIKTQPITPIDSIEEILEIHLPELISLGWEIQHQPEFLGLYRRYKNGKLLKWPDVSLTYQPTIEYQLLLTDTGMAPHEIDQKRPWVTDCRWQARSSFGHLHSAAQRLMEHARKYRPGADNEQPKRN
ncbi:MAG: hypothetical protein IBX58_14410 [Roseovarius sp.]|nr:hypothetical protein [Roseovarius sp.]